MEKEIRNGYLRRNTAVIAIGELGTKFVSFFLVPLYTHVLTAEQYGTTDFVYTLSAVLMPVLTLNIAEAILRFSMDRDAEHDKILSLSMVVLAGAGAAALAVIPLSGSVSYIRDYGLCTYLYAVSLILYQTVGCFLRGREKLQWYAAVSIVHGLAAAVLNILFLVVWEAGVTGYLLAAVLANLLCAGMGVLGGRLWLPLRRFRLVGALAGKMLGFSLALLPTSLLWWISDAADRVMVTAIAGAAANGLYAVSYKIPAILASVAGIFNRAWVYSAISEEGSADEGAYTNRVYERFAGVVMLAAAGCLMIVRPFLALYVGEAFQQAWKSVPFLIMAYVFQALSTFLVTQYMTKKDSRGLLRSAALGAGVNVGLNVPLIWLWGAPGAAAGTALSCLAVLVYTARDTRRYVKVALLSRRTGTALCLLGLMCATLFWDSVWQQGLLCAEFLGVGLALKIRRSSFGRFR